MKKYIAKLTAFGFLVLPLFFMALHTHAAGLVPCNGDSDNPCHFSDLWLLVNNIITFLFLLILPIAAIIFAYVGFLFITSGGSSEVRSQAKKTFFSAIKGLVLMLAAWLIVKVILIALGAPVSWLNGN